MNVNHGDAQGMTRAHHILFESFFRAALVTAIATAGAGNLSAQTARAKNKSAAASHDCGHGVSLRLTSSAAAQGSLLEAEVRSSIPLAGLKAEWAGHELPLWPDAARKNLQRALLGVDLEQAPGKYDLKLTAQLAAGEPFACSLDLSVKAGKFAIEKLTVAKQFAEPSAEEVARANQERQHLREIFGTVTPERFWRGAFRMPLDGARNAKNFGRRRILNGEPGSPHSGVDLPAAAGTAIHAAQRGHVVLAEELFFSGNTVVIDHGLGVYTFYGHMESLAVAAGDSVEKGAMLGKVGATGRVTGPHLHWGLTVNQARVNPLQILALVMN
jgi:murein DD-endopeptidase MepM/ murein hydrolase activator NlpD